jgi:oligoribonuclease NrnB/cAMP/cGMP phosphodiesterase (DHH superfamily)
MKEGSSMALICYHHTDMDGKSAGWLVAKYNMKQHLNPSNFHPYNYGDNIEVTEADTLIMVDISVSETDYQKFHDAVMIAKKTIWIDHHQTSLNSIERHSDWFDSVVKEDKLIHFVCTAGCGAMLTYIYFTYPALAYKYNEGLITFGTYETHGGLYYIMASDELQKRYSIPCPEWLKLVDDYDCWKQINGGDQDAFQLAFDSNINSVVIKDSKSGLPIFNRAFWNKFDGEYIAFDMVKKGKTIDTYLKMRYYRELNSAFTITINGEEVLCMNNRGNSKVFGKDIKKYAAVILFNFNGTKWYYSIYSDNHYGAFDCSSIAETFGGGGHPGAAGFTLNELILFAGKEIIVDKEDLTRKDV